MLFYQNWLLAGAQPHRPGGKEFRVFHRLGVSGAEGLDWQ
jgi:hypothetical protein